MVLSLSHLCSIFKGWAEHRCPDMDPWVFEDLLFLSFCSIVRSENFRFECRVTFQGCRTSNNLTNKHLGSLWFVHGKVLWKKKWFFFMASCNFIYNYSKANRLYLFPYSLCSALLKQTVLREEIILMWLENPMSHRNIIK